jgi:hypothetical protein
MTYPNRILDNSPVKTSSDYRREAEMRDSDAFNRSEAAKQAAKTRKLNKLRKEAEAAVEALSSREQIALAKRMLQSAMNRANSAARNALESGEPASGCGQAFWEVNSAVNGLKSDLDQSHRNWEWFVLNNAKKG